MISNHLVISCSHDKSVILYQLPMYFPAEMMRGEDQNRIKRKDVEVLSEEEKQLRESEFLSSTTVIDKVQESLISKTAVLKSKKHLEREYTDHEKYCEDLNGWDN